MIRTRRPPFDVRHEFVASPPAGRASIVVGGAVLTAGQPLDKSKVDVRRLRQMYDSRWISVAPGSTVPAPGKKPRAIGGPEGAAPRPEAAATSRPRGISRRRSTQAA